MLRVAGILLLVAIGCEAFLIYQGLIPFAITRQVWGRQVGEALGGMLAIFLVALAVAFIVSRIGRKGARMPGVFSGVLAALILTYLAYYALSHQP